MAVFIWALKYLYVFKDDLHLDIKCNDIVDCEVSLHCSFMFAGDHNVKEVGWHQQAGNKLKREEGTATQTHTVSVSEPAKFLSRQILLRYEKEELHRLTLHQLSTPSGLFNPFHLIVCVDVRLFHTSPSN